MSKKAKILIVVLIIIGLVGGGVYYYFTRENSDSTLTVLDQQWIDQNKNKIFDIEIVNQVPVFNYNGSGVFFDYLTDLEEITGLDFNKKTHEKDTVIENGYALTVKTELNETDNLFYQDNAVLVSKTKKLYQNTKEINNMSVGIITGTLDTFSKYFKESANITYQEYTDVEKLFYALHEGEVSSVITPLISSLNYIVNSESLNINYQIKDQKYNYVLSLGTEDKLNTIMKKYFNKWFDEKYQNSFDENFLNNYFSFKNISDKERVEFQSDKYVYGFLNNIPFNYENNNKRMGINDKIIHDFSKLTNIDIEYKKYKDAETLENDFNSSKIDFYFDTFMDREFDIETYKTISIFDQSFVITSSFSNPITISSLYGLKDYEVMTLENSKIDEILTGYNLNIKKYKTIENLMDNVDQNSVIAIDYETYQFNLRRNLHNFKIDYEHDINNNYNFVFKNIESNKILEELFNYYLTITPKENVIAESYISLLSIRQQSSLVNKILILGTMTIGILGLIFAFIKFFPSIKRRKRTLSKEEKLRYIDSLTSLKNRNYLNDNIEEWDDSDIYPQGVVIVDLNNVAYINDNYGHAEGDAVIIEASDILLKNQVTDTEIIRTNGNEFLIYFVGYDEKQIAEYIKRITKDLKTLTHGFGAAVGYSMITDAIKTVDDAINEATIDMRNNKENINN